MGEVINLAELRDHVDLVDTAEKAMATAIRVLEEARATIHNAEYYVWAKLVSECLDFLLTAPDWDDFPNIKEASDDMALASLALTEQGGFCPGYLDELREDLSQQDLAELGCATPELRNEDIECLKKMLAYYRSIK